MSQALISIIIPTFNRSHLIGETLTSIIKQTYTNWECIVVDDGSTDDTNEVMKAYCKKDNRFKYHHRPKDRPKGANACRNYGFEKSKGEYINWFDSDDVLIDVCLENKVKAFTNEINMVICAVFYVDENLKNKQKQDLILKTNLYKDYVLWNLKIITDSVLFRKSFLVDKDLFSLKISRGQETELFSRLFFGIKENTFKILNQPLILYRQHSNTKSFTNFNYNKNYKESQAYIAIENFKKALILRDIELFYYFYETLIRLFFRGIEKKHISNSKNILLNTVRIIYPENKWVSCKLFFFGYLCLLLNRRSFKVKKIMKSFKTI